MKAFPARAVLAALLLLGLTACGEPTSPSEAGPAFPEAILAYPISHILVQPRRSAPTRSLADALAILEEIRGGRTFAEVARDRSEDSGSARLGGFLGFFRAGEDDALNAAVLAVPMGAISGPFDTAAGTHIVYRHSFEEGRAIEAAHAVAAYGFSVPWQGSTRPAPRTREEAEALAVRLRDELGTGKKGVADAYREVFSAPPERADVLIGVVRDVESQRTFYEALRAVDVGQWLPVRESPSGFSVVQRGPLLRVLVRHILIQHVGSPDRQMSVQRVEAEARALAERVLAEVAKDGSNWNDLVKRYSDDALSQPLLGFIGCATNGDLAPAIEAALMETPPGTVFPRVVETARGFHIVYRVK